MEGAGRLDLKTLPDHIAGPRLTLRWEDSHNKGRDLTVRRSRPTYRGAGGLQPDNGDGIYNADDDTPKHEWHHHDVDGQPVAPLHVMNITNEGFRLKASQHLPLARWNTVRQRYARWR